MSDRFRCERCGDERREDDLLLVKRFVDGKLPGVFRFVWICRSSRSCNWRLRANQRREAARHGGYLA